MNPENYLPLIAQWGLWIAAVLLAATLFGLWRLGRGRKLLVPATWPRRAGSGALLLLALALGGVLFLILGPLSPMLAEVRRLHAGLNRPAPDAAFYEVGSDAPHRISELKGKVVLVNVWATWCPPCRKELPDLEKLQMAYADRGLVVLTVSTEEAEQLEKFAAEQPLRTLNAYSPDLGWYDAPGRPISFVIDRDGTVRELLTGGQTYGDFETAVRPFLG